MLIESKIHVKFYEGVGRKQLLKLSFKNFNKNLNKSKENEKYLYF